VTVIDPVFGDIVFTEAGGWEGLYTYPFLGQEVTVRLAFWADSADEPINPIQREAMRLFNERRDELCPLAEDAIFAHYRQRLPELREQFGASADELMPIVSDKQGLRTMVTPTTLFISEPLLSDDRVIGLLYDCTWEPELGLAVKFVNETIEEVGPQDIVL
jgi:hypothetical protein